MRTHAIEYPVSDTIKGSHLTAKDEAEGQALKVGFLLLENFSMASFTSSVDALITANLFSKSPIFETKTLGIKSISVESDLKINISTDLVISNKIKKDNLKFDIIIICGGYRCDLKKNETINSFLLMSHKKGIYLASLWNGVVHLANAGLLNGVECSAHPNNHSYIKENFPGVNLSNNTFVINNHTSSSAGISSSQEMALGLIEKFKGKSLVKSIREVLSCDNGPNTGESIQLNLYENKRLPECLKSVLKLMENNIEEPLKIDDIVNFCALSRRKMERLFQKHLKNTPSKFYLKIRLTHAHRLLMQSNASITNIAIASGFTTSSHFSNSFKDHFGISPKQKRLNNE